MLLSHIEAASTLLMGYNIPDVMGWEVEHSDEFEEWFTGLAEDEQIKIAASVGLVEAKGPSLDHPYSSQVNSSRFGEMRELRIQVAGQPWRVFYAFDPRRMAYLIIGGCKTGNDRFYEQMVPLADKIRPAPIGDMMAKKFRDLMKRTLSGAAQAAAQAETQAMLAEMNLRELRENLSTLSQDDVAKLLEVTQPYISKLERQSDMLVSKLFE
jgi:predicted XRE-type DNA-binding protein